MPEQLEHAVGVKDVPTLKLDTCLFLKLTGVADSAKLLAILTQGTLTSWIQARQTVCFTFDAMAGMATGLKAVALDILQTVVQAAVVVNGGRSDCLSEVMMTRSGH